MYYNLFLTAMGRVSYFFTVWKKNHLQCENGIETGVKPREVIPETEMEQIQNGFIIVSILKLCSDIIVVLSALM